MSRFVRSKCGSQIYVAKAMLASRYIASEKVEFHRLILSPSVAGTNAIARFYKIRTEGLVGRVELADEFRTRAQRCLKLAQEAPTLEAQTHWLAMAQLWFSLAQHAEEQDAQFLSNAASRLGVKHNGNENGHSNGNSEGEGEGEQ